MQAPDAMQIVDAATTRRHLGFPALFEALRTRFGGGCKVPPRQVHAIGDAGTLLVMPAWRAGARLGIKTVAIFPGNGARGLPGLHSTYLLFDAAAAGAALRGHARRPHHRVRVQFKAVESALEDPAAELVFDALGGGSLSSGSSTATAAPS